MMILKNLNSIMTNLADITLTENEISVLKYGLTPGFLTRLKKSKMIVITEVFWTKFYKMMF